MRILVALCLALLTSGCLKEEGDNNNNNAAQQLGNGLNFTNGTFVAPTPTPTPAPDTESPVLTILGTEPMVVLQDSEWVDPGVIVRDNVDPDRIVYSTDTVDTSVPTIITVTYRATDAAGNVGNQVKRNVRILEADTTPPVITLIGNNPLIHTQGTPFTDPGALVSDNKDNDRNITGLGTVDNNTLGSYTITYNAIDDAGNSATEVIRTVVVQAAPDTVPPVITLLGANPLVVLQGDTYTDPGATVTDNKDATRTITGTGTVDVNTVGTYTVTYNASDEAGNDATEVIRTVEVQTPPDTEPPVISLIGASAINIDQGDTFTDPGATVTDNVDSTRTITGTGSVDTNTVGSYTVTYNATDVAGNNATEVIRTIEVQTPPDTQAPVISLIGASAINIDQGDTFEDPGAMVTDNVDSTQTITGTGSVDTNTVGSYTLTYNATDTAGNAATPITRTVMVNLVDTEAPVISLIGASTITLTIGGTFTDPGAVVTDNIDSVKTITGVGTVDTNATGSYTLTYNATDVAGNDAVEITRTVVVEAAPTPTPTPEPPNLLANGNLVSSGGTTQLRPGDTKLTGWTVGGTGSALLTSPNGIQFIPNTSQLHIAQSIAVTPGRTYTLSIRLNKSYSGSGAMTAVVRSLPTGNQLKFLTMNPPTSFSWTTFETTFTATESEVNVRVDASTSDFQTWLLSDVSVK